MVLWKRAGLLGFLSWMIPFIVSFIVFPLKKANAPLFGTLMSLVVLLTGAALLNRYFRDRPVSVYEAVRVGALWLAINLLFDYPMFAYGPHEDDGVGLLLGNRPGLPGVSYLCVWGGAAGAIVMASGGASLSFPLTIATNSTATCSAWLNSPSAVARANSGRE